MKKNSVLKGVLLTTSLAVLVSFFSPLTSFAESTDKNLETPDSLNAYLDEEKAIQEEELDTDLTTAEFLNQDIVEADIQDTRDFIQYTTTTDEFNNYIGEEVNHDGAQASGVVGGALKAIKAFGYVCRVGGKALKYAIKPLSPSKAKLIDHNARKIAYGIEKVDKATKGAVTSALVKAGIPKKTAEAITEIIFWII